MKVTVTDQMKHGRASVIYFAGLLMLANAAPGAEAQDAAVFPAPRLVTAETRDNPRALENLQKSGKIFFEDDFESDASLKNYLCMLRRRTTRFGMTTSRSRPATSVPRPARVATPSPRKKSLES
ncbi:MAG: hypothetical protein K9N23_09480 [Akkermansiaceae bacterium]|nr:hypothetical protein [Akkermansiaceae bacterium]